jgi:hypothetical protein
MQNNISKINTIYKSLLSFLVLTACGFGLFVYYVDPYTNYVAPYHFFIIFTIILFLVILFLIIHFKLKVFKKLIFTQKVSKYALNSAIFASSMTFFLLLIYTNSLNLVSFIIFCVALLAYYTFEFLE